MATPEELLQQEITQRTEEAKLLQKKLTLLEEEKIGKEEPDSYTQLTLPTTPYV